VAVLETARGGILREGLAFGLANTTTSGGAFVDMVHSIQHRV
jgi:hypothetical protein